MNILIIGIGRMGQSHLKSFIQSKKKYNIYIVDRAKNLIKIKKTIQDTKDNIVYSSKVLSNKVYDLCIISTKSKDRFLILKKIKNIKIKKFLLEKLLFSKTKYYKEFETLYKNKIKNIYVNTWGKFIFDILKENYSKKIICNVKKGELLATVIHLMEFFYFYSNKENMIVGSNNKMKFIRSKNIGYDELSSDLFFKTKNFEMEVRNNNYKNNIIKIFNNKFEIKIKDHIIFLYKKKTLIKTIPFPLASRSTEHFFLKKMVKNIDNNFLTNSELSEKLLKFLNKYKNVNII